MGGDGKGEWEGIGGREVVRYHVSGKLLHLDKRKCLKTEETKCPYEWVARKGPWP